MKSLGIACLFAATSLFAQSQTLPQNRIAPNADVRNRDSIKHDSNHLDAASHARIVEGYGKLPLSFEPNLGQSDPSVRFLSRGAGYTLFLTSDEAILSLLPANRSNKSAIQSESSGNLLQEEGGDHANRNAKRQTDPMQAVRMQLLGSRRDATVTGTDELPGKMNYFLGSDSKKWNTSIATFAKVRYRNVLDGVDLVYYGNQGQLEYDFVVAAGAKPGDIHLAFNGARRMYVEKQTGDLVLKIGKSNGEVRFRRPVAYQDAAPHNLAQQNDGSPDAMQQANAKGTGKQLVAVNYVVDSRNHVGFQLGPYDHSRTLLIDPTLSYSTYLGGISNDYGTSIAVDSEGNAYVTGYTSSMGFPVTPGSFEIKCGGACTGTNTDAFVTKLDATGSALIFSTFLGGAKSSIGNGITLDPAGNVFVVGQTFTTDFPVTSGAFQTSCGGASCVGGDAFITELNPSGSALVYSTYLGGAGINQGNAIVLDSAGDAYVMGYTGSIDFPVTKGAFQTTLAK